MVFKLSNIKAFILEKLTPKLLHKIKSISVGFFSKALGSFKTLQHKEAQGFKKKKNNNNQKNQLWNLVIPNFKYQRLKALQCSKYQKCTAIHEGVPPRQSLCLLNFKYQHRTTADPSATDCYNRATKATFFHALAQQLWGGLCSNTAAPSWIRHHGKSATNKHWLNDVLSGTHKLEQHHTTSATSTLCIVEYSEDLSHTHLARLTSLWITES